jgi:hypothetical protein
LVAWGEADEDDRVAGVGVVGDFGERDFPAPGGFAVGEADAGEDGGGGLADGGAVVDEDFVPLEEESDLGHVAPGAAEEAAADVAVFAELLALGGVEDALVELVLCVGKAEERPRVVEVDGAALEPWG